MCAKFVCVVLVASFVCGALALPSQDNSERDLVNLINKLDNEDSVPLFGGMRIDRTETGRSFGSAKAIESFEDRAERYLETHELNLSFSGDEQDENAENAYSGRAMEGKQCDESQCHEHVASIKCANFHLSCSCCPKTNLLPTTLPLYLTHTYTHIHTFTRPHASTAKCCAT